MKNKSMLYEDAVYNFFGSIPEVDEISGVKFIKATKKRIYFVIDQIELCRYGYGYVNVFIFVRKKDLSVEMCNIETGAIQTDLYRKSFEESMEEWAEEYYD